MYINVNMYVYLLIIYIVIIIKVLETEERVDEVEQILNTLAERMSGYQGMSPGASPGTVKYEYTYIYIYIYIYRFACIHICRRYVFRCIHIYKYT
jgi:hypothetical protein